MLLLYLCQCAVGRTFFRWVGGMVLGGLYVRVGWTPNVLSIGPFIVVVFTPFPHLFFLCSIKVLSCFLSSQLLSLLPTHTHAINTHTHQVPHTPSPTPSPTSISTSTTTTTHNTDRPEPS
ncbi:MAG: hypothetical protein BYD32DRAFT_403318 [Podila humilis]|nr:MAG: hypothetical protein BYD32DRAFT_403318 [Podila humilis]